MRINTATAILAVLALAKEYFAEPFLAMERHLSEHTRLMNQEIDKRRIQGGRTFRPQGY